MEEQEEEEGEDIIILVVVGACLTESPPTLLSTRIGMEQTRMQAPVVLLRVLVPRVLLLLPTTLRT